jgi:hypothetical protein
LVGLRLNRRSLHPAAGGGGTLLEGLQFSYLDGSLLADAHGVAPNLTNSVSPVTLDGNGWGVFDRSSSQHLWAAGFEDAQGAEADYHLMVEFEAGDLVGDFTNYNLLTLADDSFFLWYLYYSDSGAEFGQDLSYSVDAASGGFVSEHGLIGPGSVGILQAWQDVSEGKLFLQLDDAEPVEAAFTIPQNEGTLARHYALGVGAIMSTNYSFTDRWDGKIRRARKWNRVLTELERAQLYNGGDGLAYGEL